MILDPTLITEDQDRAINSRGENVIVSASAGSGKTTTMMQRVISLITDDTVRASLDEMLICTFTRASAADMKEKLFKGLTEEYDNTGDERYEKQRNILQTADVCTIDSWCQKIIKTYFYAIDVDPGFDVLEEYASDALLSQSAEDAIREFLLEPSVDFTLLYDGLYSKRTHERLREIITTVYKFAIVQPDPREWLNGCLKYYDGSFKDEYDEFFERMRVDLVEAMSRAAAAIADEPDAKTKKELSSRLEALEKYVEDKGIDVEKGKVCKPPNSVSNVKFYSQYAYMVAYKKASDYCFGLSECAPARINAAQAKEVVKLVLRTMDLFEEKKERRAQLDFSDLEHLAYEILSKADDVLEDLKSKYRFIFVDEYQDVNPLQDALIGKLRGEGNTFFVGDIKQSIYAFRGCDPTLFAGIYDNPKQNKFGAPINFNANFRCGTKIIDFVNGVFDGLMTKNIGAVDYSKNRLTPGNNNGEGEVKAVILKVPGTSKPAPLTDYFICDEEDTDLTVKRAFALRIASDVIETVRRHGGDYSSVAILTPKRYPMVMDVYRFLKSAGVPVNVSDKVNMSSNPSVRLLVDFLKAIRFEGDDVAFVSVATSPIFKITLDELAAIKNSSYDDIPLCFKARKYADKDDETAKKLKEYFDFTDRYYSYAGFMRVGELLGKFCAETDYFNRTLVRFGAASAELLSDFLDMTNASAYGGSVSEFLDFVDNGGDEVKRKTHEDCVNILTVHMSKGLEFPYVFLLGSETDYTKSGGPKLPIKLDKKLGFAIKTINEKNHTIDDNPLTLFLDRRADLREKEERMRLLYVALTRAKHGLYIYATVKDSGSNAFFKFGEVNDNTYFSFMSRSIARLGYETVEAVNLDCESTAKPQRVWGKGDEKWVNALTNVFAAHSTTESGERVKTSVTALSAEAAQESARSFDPERKMGDEAGDILTRTGTAYHKCMELIDFDKSFDENAKGLNSETVIDFDLVELSKIETCYNAVLPLTKGAKVYKEKQFIATQGKTLVQGVIDLLIVRDGKATVVDYKNSQARHLVKGDPSYAQYERQVGIYAEAVKNILGLEVEKVALYSFKSGEFITFD